MNMLRSITNVLSNLFGRSVNILRSDMLIVVFISWISGSCKGRE